MDLKKPIKLKIRTDNWYGPYLRMGKFIKNKYYPLEVEYE